MTEYKNNYKSQIEINDLIGDAVKNAVARRNQVIDSEDALLALSNEEARSITGAIYLANKIICGMVCPDPFPQIM